MTATRPTDDSLTTTHEKADLAMTTDSTTTTPTMPAQQAASHRSAAAPVYRTTLPGVVRAEWIKLRTLRSTWIMLLAVLVTTVAFGAVAAAASTGAVTTPNGGGPGGAPGGGDPLSTVLSGAMLAVTLVGVLGVLLGAREYVSGLIRSYLSAVPTRLPVLWAKVIAFALAVVPVALLSVVLAYVVGMAVLGAGGVATVGWADPGTLRVVLGTAGYIVGIGVIGLALGMLLRNTAGAVTALLGGVLVLPALAGALLPDSWNELLKYLPSNAGSAFTSSVPTDSLLSSGAGALVFIGWIVLAVAGAAVALLRRDA